MLPSPRQRVEALHDEQLASCAVREADSGGRRHPEPEHPYRTCFQRDRDRIIHSSAFRRLDYKTQAFVPHEQDHFRTRLTHTIEVAQIARDLARALALNEDLAEAVALAHDLGHPPFGHAGEKALAALMADRGGFEHNRQSLRVVDYLEHPYPAFRGLNLTRAVRECLAKHETAYDHPACEEFADDGRAPLEGQLVDQADEIAYTAADMEDALTAGWIDRKELDSLDLWRRAWAAAERDAPDARPIHKQIRACKNVLALPADDLVATALAHIETLDLENPDAVRTAPTRAAAFSEPMAGAMGRMQRFLLENVYRHPRSAAHDAEAGRVIGELFEAYVADAARLPERYRRRIGEQGVHRVACDYIAGMTDRFCRAEHRSLSR